MKRGIQYDCKHMGSVTVYCATFADVQRVRLCAPCMKAINENDQDPRSVDFSVSGAVRLRDTKHG